MKISKQVTILGVALGIALVGAVTAVAATSGPEGANGRISACYSTNGTLWVPTSGSTCGGDKSVSWVGHLIQSTVNADGTFGNAYGVSKVTHTAGSGIYDVFLKGPTASYQNCVQTATLAFAPGQISVEGGVGPSEIQVQTYNASGQSADGRSSS